MSDTLVRRSGKVGLILSLTLVFGLFLGVLPALASAASTAFVNIHNVLAGQDGKVFTVRVNNTESAGVGGVLAGTTIKEVRIMPPPDLIDAVLPGSSGPGQFTDIAVVGNPPAEIRFRVPGAKPGGPQPAGGLAPGANGTFTIAADVRDTLLQDGWENWRIRVTSDMVNYTASTPTGENLRTDIRVLQVQSVAVVSPTGAADDRDGDGNPEVTGTQGNVCVRTRVLNAAAGALTVSPSVSAGSFTVGPARPTGGAPCSGAPLAGGSASIPSAATRDFDFLLTANDVGSKTTSELVATASANGSATPDTTDPDDDDFLAKRGIVIEPKARFSYDTNTLAPRAVVPGSTGKTFSIGFDKAPAGSPPLSQLTGDFQSPFCNAALQTPSSLGDGAVNNQVATYAPCNIAALADGRYQPTARFAYTDGNGLIQALTAIAPDLEKVRLDSLIPDVDLNLVPPASQVQAVPPTEPAVTDGQTFSGNGTVTDASPDTGEDTPCGTNPPGSTAPLPCTLEFSNLIQYSLTAQQGGGAQSGPKIPVPCSLNSAGNISCSLNVTFAPNTHATALEVGVSDETENLVVALSELVDVDLVEPEIVTATTQRGGNITVGDQTIPGQRRTIVVQFNEPVQDSNNAQDWIVQDGSTKTVCNVSQSPDKRTVTLTTCQELNADTEGTITYDPSLPTSSPYHDRVGLEVDVPAEPTLIDGIAPLAPTFSTVNGRGLQDGAFYFNNGSPEVVLIDGDAPDDDPAIADGYTVELYKETNGVEGLQRVGDTQCGGDVAAGDSVTLSCSFGLAEGPAKVYAISIDVNDNIGLVSLADFILDLTRPVFASVVIAGTEISVNFSEPLSQLFGTETAGNWKFDTRRVSDGQRVFLQVTADADGANTSQRKLTFSYGEHSAATVNPFAVQYRFDVGDRYGDRAGNEFLDGDALF
ncbi:MAG: hypothetical protein ACRDH9_03490 [Actinomycetota bacterium]